MKLYPKDRRALLEAAMGRRPCDLAVENVRFVNVFTGEIYPAVVYVLDGFVAYVEEGGRADPALAHQVVDGQGAYLTPGFVDPHVHIESAMLTPRAFAAAVVPHGTTTVVTDPHEIANVLGEQAVVYMHDAAEDLPMRQLVDIPSCVPAVPGLENSGAEFDAGTVHRLAKLPRVIGLAEVMDFLAVAQGEQRMLDMLDAAQQEGLYVQGHVPVSDKRLLSAYAIGGPTTCHETREGEDAVSKLRLGLRIDARESSIAKDVEKIYSQVRRLRYLDRVSLCTDDREAHDILENGHMDNALRKAVACGMDGVDALRCATLHPALESGLSNLGAVAPGYAADFLLLEDLKDFRVRAVYYGGRLVARDGVLTQEITPKTFALEQMDTMRVPPLKREDFDIAAPVEQGVVKVNVLHFAELEKSNTTRCVEEIPVRDGKLDLSQQPDLCYVKIVNRHGKGTVCSGVTRGFGLKEGAFASTVSHDSHNLCVVYRDADSAYEACRALVACRGGMCCAMPGRQTVTLPLPVAGLMSTLPCGELARQAGEMKQALRRAGMPQSNPLVRIVTMALPVIPTLRITTRGVVDVVTQQYV